MDEQLKYGLVKFYDGRDGKRFGFLVPTDEYGIPTGEEDLFFHLSGGHVVGNDGMRVTLTTETEMGFRRLRVDPPEKNDLLIYTLGHNKKGPMAKEWAYAEDWAAELRCLEMRPTYRVSFSFENFGLPMTVVLWVGQNLIELSLLFPRIVHSDGHVILDMLEKSDSRDGKFCFEVYREDDEYDQLYDAPPILVPGGWEKCDDPRTPFYDIHSRIRQQLMPNY